MSRFDKRPCCTHADSSHKVRLTRAGSPLAGDERAFAEANETGEGEQAYREFLEKARKENPEQASLMSVQPLTLKEVQRLLGPGQVLLQYLVTPERSYLWAVERTRLSAYTIAVSRNELKVQIDALRRAVSNIESVDDCQRIAQDLHERLLSPASSRLRGKEIIVVPHDVLHYLPFHALYSAQGKYLVENHAVSYLSSASLLQFVSSKRRDKASKVLSVGNPQVGSDRENLLLAELEVAEIQRHYPASMMLLRDEASEAAIKRMSPQFDVLHFAGHAELNQQEPLASAILLAGGSGEDGRLQVAEVFRMNLKASLVVLSGCETALGQLSTGDELVGLTRAFIYAGTPSVIASLWKVDDASTAQLMSRFYENFKTTTKAEALRQAQLAMIRGEGKSDRLARRGVGGIGKLGESQSFSPASQAKASPSASIATSHPYFWAPFVLVEDGK
jgi:CHAT domain-containing protein